MSNLRILYDHEREFNAEERAWLGKLLSIDFEDKDILERQVAYAKVVGGCGCGCKTVDVRVDGEAPRAKWTVGVPVEMQSKASDGMTLLFLLHMADGYINELEVLRMDSEPITEAIDITDAEVSTNTC